MWPSGGTGAEARPGTGKHQRGRGQQGDCDDAVEPPVVGGDDDDEHRGAARAGRPGRPADGVRCAAARRRSGAPNRCGGWAWRRTGWPRRRSPRRTPTDPRWPSCRRIPTAGTCVDGASGKTLWITRPRKVMVTRRLRAQTYCARGRARNPQSRKAIITGKCTVDVVAVGQLEAAAGRRRTTSCRADSDGRCSAASSRRTRSALPRATASWPVDGEAAGVVERGTGRR